jgi:hypothetical protein
MTDLMIPVDWCMYVNVAYVYMCEYVWMCVCCSFSKISKVFEADVLFVCLEFFISLNFSRD